MCFVRKKRYAAVFGALEAVNRALEGEIRRRMEAEKELDRSRADEAHLKRMLDQIGRERDEQLRMLAEQTARNREQTETIAQMQENMERLSAKFSAAIEEQAEQIRRKEEALERLSARVEEGERERKFYTRWKRLRAWPGTPEAEAHAGRADI